MCNEYHPSFEYSWNDPRLIKQLQLILTGGKKAQRMYPRRTSHFLRATPESDPHDEAVPPLEYVVGRWGMYPPWLKEETKYKRLSTWNCVSETAATKPTFKHAWNQRQRCVIPAKAFFEPHWLDEKTCVKAKIERADGEDMAIAGLWERSVIDGQELLTYTMLTIDASDHPLLNQYHRPEKEKRTIVVLNDDQVGQWLTEPDVPNEAFLHTLKPEQFVAVDLPKETNPEKEPENEETDA